MSAQSGLFSFDALTTNSTDTHWNRSRTKARNSSVHSMDNCMDYCCSRSMDSPTMDIRTKEGTDIPLCARNNCLQ
jgi:hypothetical protein